MFKCVVTKNNIRCVSRETITAGSQNTYEVSFEFCSSWDNIHKQVMFRKDKNIPVVIETWDNDTVTIPASITKSAGYDVYVGILGTDINNNNQVIVPTLWCQLGTIQDSVNNNDEGLTPDPDPSVYSQIIEKVEETQKIAQSVRDDADNGKFDGFSPTVSVTKVGHDTTITITDKDGEHSAVIHDGESGDLKNYVKSTTVESITAYNDGLAYSTDDKTYTHVVNSDAVYTALTRNQWTDSTLASIRQKLKIQGQSSAIFARNTYGGYAQSTFTQADINNIRKGNFNKYHVGDVFYYYPKGSIDKVEFIIADINSNISASNHLVILVKVIRDSNILSYHMSDSGMLNDAYMGTEMNQVDDTFAPDMASGLLDPYIYSTQFFGENNLVLFSIPLADGIIQNVNEDYVETTTSLVDRYICLMSETNVWGKRKVCHTTSLTDNDQQFALFRLNPQAISEPRSMNGYWLRDIFDGDRACIVNADGQPAAFDSIKQCGIMPFILVG